MRKNLFKKIRDTKGTFHAKMGSIKDRNGMDLTEAEDIKRRWQEYIEELCKKDLHDPDDYNGVIIHLEPDRRQWHPTPVLLPGKSHGRRSLEGCSPWSRWGSDMTERLHFHFSLSCIGRRKWQPTPVVLPGESQGRGSLVGFRLWGLKESDTTEVT